MPNNAIIPHSIRKESGDEHDGPAEEFPDDF